MPKICLVIAWQIFGMIFAFVANYDQKYSKNKHCIKMEMAVRHLLPLSPQESNGAPFLECLLRDRMLLEFISEMQEKQFAWFEYSPRKE